MADDFLAPIEVPWKLASTTQLLGSGGPDETTLSLFFHEPADETLIGVDPDEKIVFFKVTASVSPCTLEAIDQELASSFLAGNLPVLHLQLDMDIRPSSGETGGIRPYFHAARPLHRRFVETGVVGNGAVEGAAEAQFFGKSGSQLTESVESSSRTTTAGASGSFTIPIPMAPISLGGGVQTTGTDVSSSRNVAQVVDTTTREASEERRELISHTTNVENVLTLLSGKYTGTPYLRFSMFPRPLQLLSLDPSDPNLWFSQLLRQRSSGIEGIQEFTAVAVVPRGMDFCVNVRLRRVCLLDDPPGPPNLSERLVPDLLQLARMVRYLYELFPIGTPLDELDLDLISELSPAKDFRRPVVRIWAFRLGAQVVEALVVSPAATAGLARGASVNYKHMLEIWLETLRAEYDQELARSPLERGAVLGENRRLQTCFTDDGGLLVSSSSRSVTPLVPIDFSVPVDAEISDELSTASVRSRAMRTIARWNALESRMNDVLTNLEGVPETRDPLTDVRVADVLISRWAKMVPDDPRNVSLAEAVDSLGLPKGQRKTLEASGVQDLRGLARALQAVPDIETLNREVERVEKELEIDECDPSTRRLFTVELPERIDFALTRSGAAAVRSSILKGLSAGYQHPAPEKTSVPSMKAARGKSSGKK